MTDRDDYDDYCDWLKDEANAREQDALADPDDAHVELPPFYFAPDHLPAMPLAAPAPRGHLPEDSAARKRVPMCTGLLDYFPDALVAVAECSWRGNQKHNPGQPLHWAREKSSDHPDCIARHLLERGTTDSEGVRHSAHLAWRALAMLQLEIEAERRAQEGG